VLRLADGDMVYNWDDKEGECYRLYVEEKRSLDEVISYWAARGFTPRYVAASACLHGWEAVSFTYLCYLRLSPLR
jgi:hypothetical protein